MLISPASSISPESECDRSGKGLDTRLSKLVEGKMENIIRAKIDQMWQIATSDACGKQTSAVADLHREISKLFQKLEPSQLEEN